MTVTAPERDSLLYVVNPDGTGKRVLTRRAFSASSPIWSPDGRMIAFRSIRHAGAPSRT